MPEQKPTPTYDQILNTLNEPKAPAPEPEPEFKPTDSTVLVEAKKALQEIRNRSFSGRHPELGKMIKCAVCNRRHRSSIVCEQKFKELWIDEDLETGEKTAVFATVPLEGQPKTIKSFLGAAIFKGKRHRPHGKGHPRPLRKVKKGEKSASAN